MSEDVLAEPRLPKSTLWQRLLRTTMPEQTQAAELKQSAGLDSSQCRAWLKRLRSRNKFVRQEAQRNFQELSQPARHLLTIMAYQSAENHRALFRTIAILSGLVMFISASVTGGRMGFTFGLLIVMVIYSIMATFLRESRHQELAKNLLDSAQEPRLVPFLLARLHYNNVNNRAPRQMFAGRNMRNALARLLPLIQENDVAEWTGTPWNHLFYYLRHPHEDVEMTLLALDLAARFGNEQALRIAEAMTKQSFNVEQMTAVGSARAALEANRKVLKNAWEECLPALRESVARQHQAQTLLRASTEGSTSAQEILLRPASACVPDTPSEQLLRASNTE